MAMTVADRKARLEHGAISRVAEKIGVGAAYVSRVLADEIRPKTRKGVRSVQQMRVLLAREMGVRVADAFPPLPPIPAAVARADWRNGRPRTGGPAALSVAA